MWQHIVVSSWNEEHLDQLIFVIQQAVIRGSVYRAECLLHCSGNYVGLLQSLCNACYTDTYIRTDRPVNKNLLKHNEVKRDTYLDCIITRDGMWYYHNQLELRQESMKWQHVNSTIKNKFKIQASTERDIYTVFWDRKNMIL